MITIEQFDAARDLIRKATKDSMSTKIHNGYRLRNQSIQKLMPTLMEFAERIVADNLKSMAKLIAEKAVDIIDTTALGKRPGILFDAVYMDQEKLGDRWIGDGTGRGYSPLQIASSMVRELATAQMHRSRRCVSYDFGCTVSIIPHPTRLLACFFSERESHRRIWERTPGVIPYPYWNNTDEPKGITRRQWEARGREWDIAMGDLGVPAMVGLTFDANVGYGWQFPRDKQVARYLPSYEDRIKEYGANLATDLAARRFRRTTDPMDRFWKARDYLRTPDGLKLIEKAELRVSRIIQPDITIDDLRKPITLIPKPAPKTAPEQEQKPEKKSGK